MIHSLIVYESQYGNTEHLARIIANALAEFGPARSAHIHETAVTQLRDVDLLIFGCPSLGAGAAQAMRDFIRRLPVEVLRGPKIACFDTRVRGPLWMRRFAAPRLVRQFRGMHIDPVAPPEGFFVEQRAGPLAAGEARRAAEWGRALAALTQTDPTP